MQIFIWMTDQDVSKADAIKIQERKIKMERRNTNRYIDLGTLVTYVMWSMIFAVAVIVLAAMILQADILTWDPTMVISVFFLVTGGICGAFILLK